MNREEILREIDEAMAELREAKRKVNETLSHARNIVARDGDDVAGYNKGLEDAWKLAKKISFNSSEGGLRVDELKKIFQTSSIQGVFRQYTSQEALQKLEAYEKAQEEIKVGDVVLFEFDNNIQEGICVAEDYEGKNTVDIWFDGNVCPQIMHISELKKTGKHIDISSILEQIGGGEV